MHTFQHAILLATALTRPSAAINLFVSSYDGTVTTLSLTEDAEGHVLEQISQSTDCGPSPAWMVHDKPNSVLYCMDENRLYDAEKPSAVFSTFSVDSSTGELKLRETDNMTTTASVSGTLFGDNKYMAVAGYFGQLSALTIDKTIFEQVQVLDFVNKTELGTGQRLDPTGKFVVVPDLGGNLVRVFTWTKDSGSDVLVEQTPYKTKPDIGPRHAVFWDRSVDAVDTYLFVLAELAKIITTYKVTYTTEGTLDFTELDTQNTFGGAPPPGGAAAGELQISPDNRFLILSNRNDATYHISRYGDEEAIDSEPADSLATFVIGDDAKLKFKQIWPAGGLHPRHFAINKAGDMVAVGLQNSCRVVVLARNAATGLLGGPLVHLSVGRCDGASGPNMVIWDE